MWAALESLVSAMSDWRNGDWNLFRSERKEMGLNFVEV